MEGETTHLPSLSHKNRNGDTPGPMEPVLIENCLTHNWLGTDGTFGDIKNLNIRPC